MDAKIFSFGRMIRLCGLSDKFPPGSECIKMLDEIYFQILVVNSNTVEHSKMKCTLFHLIY